MVQGSDIIYDYNMECISLILHYCGQTLGTDNLKVGLILAPIFGQHQGTWSTWQSLYFTSYRTGTRDVTIQEGTRARYSSGAIPPVAPPPPSSYPHHINPF